MRDDELPAEMRETLRRSIEAAHERGRLAGHSQGYSQGFAAGHTAGRTFATATREAHPAPVRPTPDHEGAAQIHPLRALLLACFDVAIGARSRDESPAPLLRRLGALLDDDQAFIGALRASTIPAALIPRIVTVLTQRREEEASARIRSPHTPKEALARLDHSEAHVTTDDVRSAIEALPAMRLWELRHGRLSVLGRHPDSGTVAVMAEAFASFAKTH